MLNLSEHGERAVGVVAKVEVLICCHGGNNGQNRYRNSFAHGGILKSTQRARVVTRSK